jgi:hypothetical protein
MHLFLINMEMTTISQLLAYNHIEGRPCSINIRIETFPIDSYIQLQCRLRILALEYL